MKQIYGLIIRKEWLDKILSGEKTWELRTANTYHRGLVFLIESGSGLIRGYTHIQDSIRLNESLYTWNRDKHCVDKSFADCHWTSYAWVLSDTHRLSEDYTYIHPRGAVIWVKLNSDIVPKFDKMMKEVA